MEFVILTDRAHSGTVVRMNGQLHDVFDVRTAKWYRTAMMIGYFSDESVKYEMYREITEDEARKIVEGSGGGLFDVAIIAQ